MNVAPIIRRTLATTRVLAEEAGLSRSYVKQMGQRTDPIPASLAARRKLSKALHARAERMMRDAFDLVPEDLMPAEEFFERIRSKIAEADALENGGST